MPRKQRFKPSRKPKQAVIAQDPNGAGAAAMTRETIGETESTRQETRGARAVIETDEPGRAPTDPRAVIDDVGSEAG